MMNKQLTIGSVFDMQKTELSRTKGDMMNENDRQRHRESGKITFHIYRFRAQIFTLQSLESTSTTDFNVFYL